jgi:phospholipase/carboxylesterase
MAELVCEERPADGEPRGLLILHHGRGTDERDMLPLAEVLDPRHQMHVALPRGPLTLEGSAGHHWYTVPRVGTPDPETFRASYGMLADLQRELWQRTGTDASRTILGGFSMGAVMSYTLGLGAGRPRPAGILAFSGFLPDIDGWEADLPGRSGLAVFMTHGSRDQVIGVSFARLLRDRLTEAGLRVSYHESEAAHRIDPRELPGAGAFLAELLAGAGGAATPARAAGTP